MQLDTSPRMEILFKAKSCVNIFLIYEVTWDTVNTLAICPVCFPFLYTSSPSFLPPLQEFSSFSALYRCIRRFLFWAV